MLCVTIFCAACQTIWSSTQWLGGAYIVSGNKLPRIDEVCPYIHPLAFESKYSVSVCYQAKRFFSYRNASVVVRKACWLNSVLHNHLEELIHNKWLRPVRHACCCIPCKWFYQYARLLASCTNHLITSNVIELKNEEASLHDLMANIYSFKILPFL